MLCGWQGKDILNLYNNLNYVDAQTSIIDNGS